MKQKYYIGFFMTVFFMVSLLGIGYQMSYQYVVDRHAAQVKAEQEQEREQIPEAPKEELVTTRGTAQKNEGYYLCALQGYVVVYLGDHETIYEMTEIPLDTLPDNVRSEVESGKYVETARELYGFLENYSS
ncbi:MAG: hypothetical protein HFH22_03050 [Ruminococcus sp.]|mgnify:FL=1|jgi:hypothetical protein|nr:hypothetical protein [uncultured Schaedlerella sp.]MCI8766430.1 hypothetical protein [Ruminococcus sp.]MCI9328807.1 hypothetical protein [Ruminococcus sp.]